MVKGIKWQDLITSYRQAEIDVSAHLDDAGMLHLVIDGEELLYCTQGQAELVFAILSRLFGKKLSKMLINVKKAPSEEAAKA